MQGYAADWNHVVHPSYHSDTYGKEAEEEAQMQALSYVMMDDMDASLRLVSTFVVAMTQVDHDHVEHEYEYEEHDVDHVMMVVAVVVLVA